MAKTEVQWKIISMNLLTCFIYLYRTFCEINFFGGFSSCKKMQIGEESNIFGKLSQKDDLIQNKCNFQVNEDRDTENRGNYHKIPQEKKKQEINANFQGKKEKIQESMLDDIYLTFKSLQIDIECFKRDKRFEKILIMRLEKDFYVCGRIYIKSLEKEKIIQKLCLDFTLKHDKIPCLFGFDSVNDGSETLEMRKIDFVPLPLTKHVFTDATKQQLYKMVTQIIEFINYISAKRHSVAFFTLDDIFSCCFIDCDFNIYFGDLSFVEVDYDHHKNLFSIGIIVYQLLGHEIMAEDAGNLRNHIFNEDIPIFWKKFVSLSLEENESFHLYKSLFMKKRDINDKYLLDNDDSDDNELEEIEVTPKDIKARKKTDLIDIIDKDIIDKHKDLRLNHIDTRTAEEYSSLNAEITEDGKTIFVEHIKETYVEKALLRFKIQTEFIHPMVLPIKGFICSDKTKRTIDIYRETNKKFLPFYWYNISQATDEMKLKLIKQITDFSIYIFEETNYKINSNEFLSDAVYDEDYNLYFVRLNISDYEPNAEDSKKEIAKRYWEKLSFTICIEELTTINFPSKIRKILDKETDERSFEDIYSMKYFLDKKTVPIEFVVNEYLMDYDIENEIEGHQCHVTFFKRHLFSNKKFKRLVLKRYKFHISFSLEKILKRIKEEERNIIDLWKSDKETFILMKFIKARRLSEVIPDLDYDLKITILKNLASLIKRHVMKVMFCNLSIDNVYVDKDMKIKLLDCIFVTENTDNPFLPPEVAHLSTIEKFEMEKVDIYSLGTIAYVMFGGKFDYQREFDYENIPLFIQYFIRICCNRNVIERSSIYSIIEKLNKYQEKDVEKLFRNDLIEISSYYIDPNDFYMPIEQIKQYSRQKSSNKILYKILLNSEYGENGTELMKCLINSSHCRNGLQVEGFSFSKYKWEYFFEITGYNRSCWFIKEYFSENILIKLIQYWADMFNHGYQYTFEPDDFEMFIDLQKQPKFFPYENRLKNIEDKAAALHNLVESLLYIYGVSTQDYFGEKVPYVIQILIWKIMTGTIEVTMMEKAFEKNNDSLKSNWREENEGDVLVYESTRNPDLIEEGIRVEIKMRCSNLCSYSRKENKFQLVYENNSDSKFLDFLYNIENLSIQILKKKEKLKDYKIINEYNGSHCLVQYLKKGEKTLVLKKYNKTNKFIDTINLGIRSSCWEEKNEVFILQNFEDVETLEDRMIRNPLSVNEEFIYNFIYKVLKGNYYDYLRFSPHNICIGKNSDELYIVDVIQLDSNNYEYFKDEFVAPEFTKIDEFDNKEIKGALIYSVGWTAYVLFGLKPEIDLNTNKFQSPTFPDDFPEFWRDFITISTRENAIDRPSRQFLLNKMKFRSSFEECDFILLSSKLLNHDDYEIENPVGAGGEAIIYLVKNKATGEKHACKKLKYEIRSREIKQIFMTLDKLDNSVNGIKYIGISMCEDKVYLHMEYVPNGSLRDLISLDRRMIAPSWFTESAKLRIAREIAAGMRSLHEHGIVHKDLKPENLLLDENNSIKICDFSFIPDEGAATPLFMAPELFNNEEATFKSDVYSFAVTLSALYGGGEMIGSVKTASSGGFRPSIAVGTPLMIQGLIMKCWQQNPDDRPTFAEIIDDLDKTDPEEFDLRLDSMKNFEKFDSNIMRGILTESYEYEICNITGDADDVEHLIRLHMTIQPDNILHIHKYCRLGDKIVLILERCEKTTFDLYLSEKKRVSQSRGEKYVSDFISLFELYHKNKFYFGPFSLKRLFFRGRHRSSIIFDLFMIPGLDRPKVDDQALISPPEGFYSREADVFAFSCFVLKIFGCLSFDECGEVIKKPFKRSSKSAKQPIPFKYQNIIMERCLSKQPMTRPTFELIFQKLFPVQYKIISTFLSVSASRFSTFSMKNDIKQEEVIFMERLGSGTFGNVVHAFNKTDMQDLAVKEFNDSHGANNEDFMLEYVALKAIDHPNIVKIVGACPRKEMVHGSRLFMEFASGGDLEKNMDEPFETFVVHLLQISSAMKYLHQRGIIHFDLKPKNILIRGDGSAVVADFNTAMHVDIDSHLRNQRGSTNYMSPEIKRGEKYSYSTDVYSFGLMAAEYFSSDAHQIVQEFNDKHEHPVLGFIPHMSLRSLIEFCVDDDPMSRPSFEFICSYIFKKFIKDTPQANELEKLTRIPRIDEDKLNQLRVLASRGSNEAIVEYGRYLLFEGMYDDAMHVFLKGANNNDPSCQNTIGTLSNTNIAEQIIDDPISFITKAAEQGDKFGLTNLGSMLALKEKIKESIEVLERAYSKGVSYAGGLIGLLYQCKEIEGMTFDERIEKAVIYYHDAAKEGDSYAQYQYGFCLEYGLATDDEGFDCVHYYRQSAYQRCLEGCRKYSEFVNGDRQEFYIAFEDLLSISGSKWFWDGSDLILEDSMSCYIGMKLYDANSREKFESYCIKMI